MCSHRPKKCQRFGSNGKNCNCNIIRKTDHLQLCITRLCVISVYAQRKSSDQNHLIFCFFFWCKHPKYTTIGIDVCLISVSRCASAIGRQWHIPYKHTLETVVLQTKYFVCSGCESLSLFAIESSAAYNFRISLNFRVKLFGFRFLFIRFNSLWTSEMHIQMKINFHWAHPLCCLQMSNKCWSSLFEYYITCEFWYPVDCDKMHCTNEQTEIVTIRTLDIIGLLHCSQFGRMISSS